MRGKKRKAGTRLVLLFIWLVERVAWVFWTNHRAWQSKPMQSRFTFDIQFKISRTHITEINETKNWTKVPLTKLLTRDQTSDLEMAADNGCDNLLWVWEMQSAFKITTAVLYMVYLLIRALFDWVSKPKRSRHKSQSQRWKISQREPWELWEMTETWLNGGDLSFVDYLQREVNKKMQIQILFRLFRHPIENRSNSTLDYQNQFPLKLFLWPQRAIWLLFHFHKPEKTREENMKHEGTMKILSLTKFSETHPLVIMKS